MSPEPDDDSVWCGEGEPSEYGAMGAWLAAEGVTDEPDDADIDAFLAHLVGEDT